MRILRLLIMAVSLSLLTTVSGDSLSKLFQKIDPTVVVINTRSTVQLKGRKGQTSQKSLGSGVLISGDGKILTAAHVVHSVDRIQVHIIGQEPLSAVVLASSVQADVALIQLEKVPEGLRFAKLGDSDKTSVGDRAIVIGSPYGLEHTLTVGYISSKRKPKIEHNMIVQAEYLQTDAAINQGNSGGPVFNDAGKLIGIVSHIKSRTGGSEGLGFATTTNVIKKLLLDQNPFWGGADTIPLVGALADAFNIKSGYGLLVQRVAHQSPGYYMGLRPGTIKVTIAGIELLIGGDIILAAEGVALSYDNDSYIALLQKLNEKEKGARIDVTILRAGKEVELFTTK